MTQNPGVGSGARQRGAPARPGRGRRDAGACHFVSVSQAAAGAARAGRRAGVGQANRPGVAGILSGQTAGGAPGRRGGRGGSSGRGGGGGGVALFERRAAGAGSRLPRPAGISSRLHAATRVGLGSAGEKQRPGRAGEGAGRARGGGAGGKGLGWGKLGWTLTWGLRDARRDPGGQGMPLTQFFLKLGYIRV